MAYRVNLNTYQQLTIVNQGSQTLISLVTNRPGQQQSQSNSFTTGQWARTPQLFQMGGGCFILQIDGDRQRQLVSIQANSISTVTTAPSLDNAVQIDLEHIRDPEPTDYDLDLDFEPMQPMQMGNMSMSMNPMSMRMGNMSIDIGKRKKSTPGKRFCTQCGQPANQGDRFCSSCGHQLNN